MLKYGGEATCQWLQELISLVWQSGKAPADWKKALIVPLHKKGDVSELNNNRGISLLSVVGKFFP